MTVRQTTYCDICNRADTSEPGAPASLFGMRATGWVVMEFVDSDWAHICPGCVTSFDVWRKKTTMVIA